MTSNSRSSASYAYYSFPPTPNRSSPPGSVKSNNSTTPQTAKTSRSMAPSPAAGKTPAKNPPSTPTKSGKNPSSSTTSKLSQSTSTSESSSKSVSKPPKLSSSTPRSSIKSGADKTKNPPKLGNSPTLPPRPKNTDDIASKTSEATPETPDPVEDVKDKAEGAPEGAKDTADAAKGAADDAKAPADDTKEKAEDTAEETSGKIGLQDNDPNEADDEDTDTPQGKISQGGNETGGEEEESVTTENLDQAAPEPVEDDSEEATNGAADKTQDTVAGAKDTVDDEAEDTEVPEEADEKATGAEEKAGGLAGAAKGLAGKATGTAGKATKVDADGATKDVADGTKDTAGETTDGVEDAAGDAIEGTKDAVNGVKDTAGDAADGAEDTADGAKDAVPDEAEDAVDGVKDTAEDAVDEAEDAVPEDAEDGVDEVKDTADDLPIDLSILKGLEVGEGGQILGRDGEPIGQLEEGDPEDLIGQEIGDDGEILDEDGDVIGRVTVVPGKAQELADGVEDEVDEAVPELPDLKILKGLEVQENGDILDSDGDILGKITEGDPADLEGQILNENGEVLDEDGDVVGRAEVVPGEGVDKINALNAAKADLPDVGVLEGYEVGEEGEVLDKDGNQLGKVVEGDAPDLAGKAINEKGEIIGEDGEVLGRAELVPGEAVDAIKEANAQIEAAQQEAEEAREKADAALEALKPDSSIFAGKKINKKGAILDEEGETIGKLTDDSDLAQCVGKIPNEKGEILNDKGEVVGRIEIVEGEAANEAMKEAHPELVEAAEEAEKAADEAKDAAEESGPDKPDTNLPDLSVLEGLKVNKKGEVLNEDGEPIARLVEGELKDNAGKKINEHGEVLDKDGNVIGKVELIVQEGGETAEDGEAAVDGAEGAIEDGEGAAEDGEGAAEEGTPETSLPDLGILEGLKVNKKGEVVNEDGDPIARLSEGELADVVGKKLNANGEILDSDGNVIGKVALIPQEIEEGEEGAEEEDQESGPEYPPLAILEGLKCNKSGFIVNSEGKQVGRLIEGDAKKLAKGGNECDAEGQFWDTKGNVIGRAETLPKEDDDEEGTFAGLEGLIVVKDGFVEDENGNKVGKLVEGDEVKLVGRAVDEDGDVIDKRGNVVGHAERYEEPPVEEETGPELPPLSILEGLKCNKNGLIVNSAGKPVGRLVEGDAKKLAKGGNLCDAEGQFWDGKGKVIGKAETLQQEDDDTEGPFAGLEGLIVVEDGFVVDENQIKVGIIVDGDAKKLIGRAVDEDGDIIDKIGNVVGRAERYEAPEEVQEEKPDLSILKGLKVNKQGNVIGPDGVPIARVVEGNPKELAGRACDEEGQVWNDSGKVMGRCELIPDNERQAKAEGPFAGLEGLVVVKDGFVDDEDGNRVGQVVEGDPKRLIGRAVDEDGDIIDKFGNVKGHAEPWEEEVEEEEVVDLSSLDGKVVNKQGNVVDAVGTIFGRVAEGDLSTLIGRKVDGQGQIWSDNGKVIGRAELIPGGGPQKAEGPFAGFERLIVVKDGMVTDQNGNIVGRVIEGDAQKLEGRKVDDDGDILDKSGNSIGKAERWEPEKKERRVNPMSGHKVNKDGEVRDADGNLIGKLTEGNLGALVGMEVDDNGNVVDNDGNKIGECTLIEHLPEEEQPEYTEEELEAMRKKEEDADLAKKMTAILNQTIDKMQPILSQITEVSCNHIGHISQQVLTVL